MSLLPPPLPDQDPLRAQTRERWCDLCQEWTMDEHAAGHPAVLALVTRDLVEATGSGYHRQANLMRQEPDGSLYSGMKSEFEGMDPDLFCYVAVYVGSRFPVAVRLASPLLIRRADEKIAIPEDSIEIESLLLWTGPRRRE